MQFKSHEEYFDVQSAEVKKRLEEVQKRVEACVPGAIRTISYNMPAFKTDRTFFYFAAFKKHIGIYPPVTENHSVIAETQALRGPKGNLSFLHSQELPLDLIGRVAACLAAQYTASRPASEHVSGMS
jgi:uncharacterized protein YdhG (YjbR/CyaY superfamily)